MRRNTGACGPLGTGQADGDGIRCGRREFGKMAIGLLGAAAIGGPRLQAGQRGAQSRGTQPPPATRPARPGGLNEAFLHEQASRIIDSAHLAAGQRAGAFRNTTPYDVHVPGGNMGYPAFWIRDAVMMLGGDFIPAAEMEGWIRLICATLQGREDWQVRPGVVVPAYAVPDHINFNGKATFYPGNYETGDKQGGGAWGKYPPLDDNFYFLTAVYEHWTLAKNLSLFRSPVKTFSGQEPLADVCEKVYKQPLADEATGLVMAGDIKSENAKDWGFCDGEFKSGKLLFPSVLKLVAARQLAEMFAAAGEDAKVTHYRDEARRLEAALSPTFLHAAEDGSEAWLHSATGVGNQPDVWGSAFAVHNNALDTPTTQRVSKALARAFREKTAVHDGFVRQILSTDRLNKGGWEASISPVGEYQNGGYWGTPVGWYVSAVHKSDPAAAADLAREYIQFLRRNMRDDGTTQAWEWYNPDTKQHVNPRYVATVALPYLSLKAAGLLNVLDPA